jgi:hypothetical protein
VFREYAVGHSDDIGGNGRALVADFNNSHCGIYISKPTFSKRTTSLQESTTQ